LRKRFGAQALLLLFYGLVDKLEIERGTMSEDNRPAFRQGLEKIERAFKDNKPFAERDKLFVSLPLPHPPHLETDIKIWNKYFALAVKLLEIEELNGYQSSGERHIKNGIWTEDTNYFKVPNYLPSYDRRFGPILKVLAKKLKQMPKLLADFTEYSVTNDLLQDKKFIDYYSAWLDSLEKDKIVDVNYISAMRVKLLEKSNWDEVKEQLFKLLDHEALYLRSMAANIIGKIYHEHSKGELEPPLSEIVKLIAEKELKRPGIAGPLMSPYFNGDEKYFEDEAGIADIKEWIFKLLEARTDKDPLDLACNDLDFFIHEMVETGDDIKRLIRAGYLFWAEHAVDDLNGCEGIKKKLDYKKIKQEVEREQQG